MNKNSNLTIDRKFLILIDDYKYDIINKINKFDKAGNFIKVWRGLTTGNDKKYINSEKINDGFKPLITGADINKYSTPIVKKICKLST